VALHLHHIRNDLRGLEYTFADRGLSGHPKFVTWLKSIIDEMVAGIATAASN
jgi:hypothetical protein